MNSRKIIIPALLLSLALPMGAKPRTKGEIMQAASRTLVKSAPGMMRSPSANISLEVLESNEAFTVVGFPGKSYAIISNDDLLPEVLGYSATSFEDSESNPGFQWWVRSIKRAAVEMVATGASSDITLPDPAKYPLEVPHLMSNVWGQMEPYNNLCPLMYDANEKLIGRAVVGCVATSTTQVMHYHQYPPQGEGIHIDMQTEDAFGRPIPLKVNFADYKYDWANVLDCYSPGNYSEKSAKAVAEIAYTTGVACGMIYGVGFSGTYTDSCEVALREHLKFPNAKMLTRSNHNESSWMETIYNELSHNHPVLYSGADDWGVEGGGGHAFVFDGYNAQGLVHVNWGWYGRNDGYYEVALLNPRIHSFKNQQDMIIGVYPPDHDSDIVSQSVHGLVSAEQLSELIAKSKEGKLHELDLSEASFADNRIPEKAFYGSRLRRIILPASIVSIGDGAFGACRDLREVVFPEAAPSQQFIIEDNIVYSKDGKEVIEVMPYYYNDELIITDYSSCLTFRDGVKSIHPYAADGCFRVQGVIIPSSLEKIGAFAFNGCSRLRVVKCESAVPSGMSARAFSTLDAGYTRLMVPAGAVDTYYRAGEWNKFFGFENVYEYGTNVVARSHVRRVGQANPDFTYQIFGDYVTGTPELSCDATAESPVGDYVINISKGSLEGDDIKLTPGVLHIVPGDLSSVDVITASGVPFNVYSIDGRIVLENATDIESLPQGVYVIGGHKVIVK